MIRCESRVSTRLRYVLKSEVICGSQNLLVRVELLQYTTLSSRRKYALRVVTEQNAPNGASQEKVTVSGEDLHPEKDNESVLLEA
jgi:hypothetical protein